MTDLGTLEAQALEYLAKAKKSWRLFCEAAEGVLVSEIDNDLLEFKWRIQTKKSGTKYVARTDYKTNKKTLFLHRAIMERVLNRPLEKGEIVDHTDGNGLNNCRENLRLVTHQQNMFNIRQSRGKTGYRGVSLRKDTGKFQASIRIEGKKKHLGYFDTAIEAYHAYCEKAKEIHGVFYAGEL